ncbi:hypothetical protein [Streptomyces sp. enrichment culture]|uniref:hypothetical protein n=1 Tax=Streptomyces sp. enrichment culture TaxID=1795815 RepID=UPI003F546A51
MKMQVIACDVDRRTPAATYTIASADGRTLKTDLCAVCARPLEALLGGAGKPAAPRPTAEETTPGRTTTAPAGAGQGRAARGRRRLRVTTLEEIEARKRALASGKD